MTGLDALFDAARSVRETAYAPYSRFRVGAALCDEAGRIHATANVENAAYPVGTCAEAGAISALIASGARRIAGVAVVGGRRDDETGPWRLITPCGACRQRLAEFAGPDTPVRLGSPEGVLLDTTVGALLPHAFALEETAPGDAS
ncbi:MAG: cytidine deaminase [Hyphomicrobiaceae bacterium]|nr:cytidine deaminase [Hyphomicrobiaceae bacterium]